MYSIAAKVIIFFFVTQALGVTEPPVGFIKIPAISVISTPKHVGVGANYTIECRSSIRCEQLAFKIIQKGLIYYPVLTVVSKQNGITMYNYSVHSERFYSLLPDSSDSISGINKLILFSKPASVNDTDSRYVCLCKFGSKLRFYDGLQLKVGHSPEKINMKLNLSPNKTVTLNTNDELMVYCSTVIRATNVTLSLYINSKIVKNGIKVSNLLKIRKKFVIAQPEDYDQAEIVCKAENKYGIIEETRQLNVFYKTEKSLIYLNGKPNETVFVGANTSLNCSARGNPAPQVRWKTPRRDEFRIVADNVIQVKPGVTGVLNVTCIVEQVQNGVILAILEKEFQVSVRAETFTTTNYNSSPASKQPIKIADDIKESKHYFIIAAVIGGIFILIVGEIVLVTVVMKMRKCGCYADKSTNPKPVSNPTASPQSSVYDDNEYDIADTIYKHQYAPVLADDVLEGGDYVNPELEQPNLGYTDPDTEQPYTELTTFQSPQPVVKEYYSEIE